VRRGTTETSLVTTWDWYATYAAIAGVDPTDERAAQAGLPPIDSINQWPLLAGWNSTAPRIEILIGDTTALTPNADGETKVGGILAWPYKLLIGTADHLYTVSQYTRTGPDWPNVSSHLAPLLHPRQCGREPERGCLFNVENDPNERNSLAQANETLFRGLLQRVDEAQASVEVYSPVRGRPDSRACRSAEDRGHYWGPFLKGAAV